MMKVLVLVAIFVIGLAGNVRCYDRPVAREMIVIDPSNVDDPTFPEQVHISLVGPDKMRISWITKDSIMPRVVYGTVSGKYDGSATGTSSSYHYLLIYRSGQINDVVIGPLKPNTVYYYKCGGPDSTIEFNFKTPPSQFPIKFAVSGDLGTTEWTKSTLEHISKWDHDVFILPGDLSYANMIQPVWDTFGRLVQPLASQRPWMVTHGNHEVEKFLTFHRNDPFTAYNHRWHMPFEESGSTSNLYYSFNVYGVHIIMLGSYTDFEPGSEQYKWLENDLKKMDRKATPWVIAVVHAPWYNTNEAHQGEKESVEMKESMETLLYNARVDLVFAGHVHAYERFNRVYQDKFDKCGPVYINIGDGGNLEGLATKYNPKPEISLFREASFGHGQLVFVNATHASWEWQRNDDIVTVQKDTVWFTSLLADASCPIQTASVG